MTGYMFKVISEILDEMRRIKREESRDMTREEYKEFVNKICTKWKRITN